MWHCESSEPCGPGIRKLSLSRSGLIPSYGETLELWRRDETFREALIGALGHAAPFEAYFWETPPVTRSTLDRPFEFVLTNSTALASVKSDSEPFASHLRRCGEGQITGFANLGGDAYLVVPCPLGATWAYPHLAAFSRHAPKHQQHALWRCVGEAMEQRVGDRPLWLSTSGLGVYWVHLRLDTRPKYYTFRPYTQAPPPGQRVD
jgi:hypothetical protein